MAALQIAGEIIAARIQLQAQRQIYTAWDSQVLPAAQLRSDMAMGAWRAGKLDFLAVVQSLRDSNEARRQRLDAQISLARAHIELARAEGRA